MNRKEAEAAILEHLLAIQEIIREYAPDDVYLTCTIWRDHSVSANNTYWEHDQSQTINLWESLIGGGEEDD